MIAQLIGPIANLAGSWFDAKSQAQAASAKLKLTEAEAKAKIMLSKETSVADWERIMAQGSQSSWKDEWFVLLFSVPLVLAFVPSMQPYVLAGFATLEQTPDWYMLLVSGIVAATFGLRWLLNKGKKWCIKFFSRFL